MRTRGFRHPVLRYTALRLLLFAAAAGLLYAFGARGPLLLALAVLISGLLSLVVLSRYRDAMSASLVGRVGSARQRIDEGAASEDDLAEESSPTRP